MIEVNQIDEILRIKMCQLFFGEPVYWVAAYLIDGLLIDTGCKHTAEELADVLKDRTLKCAVNTHYHEDHIGANALLKEKFGIEIFAHPDSVPLIRECPEINPYREVAWGNPEPSEAAVLPDSIDTPHYHFDVIDTPGHSRGHVVLVEPDKGWCFSGDLFVGERPRVIRPDDVIPQTILSLKKLLETKTTDLVLFTAGGRIVRNGRRAVQTCVDYLEDISEKVLEVAQKGHSYERIVETVFGGENIFEELTGGDYSSKNMVRSIIENQM
jgi:glyoxylase-like metal-dependent hydrolase (beta-lactamase superfamily II)